MKQVENREAFKAALEAEAFDIILSDFHLPSFTGLDALAIVKKKCPHTPFILISGTIGEQAAIESLKAGATDYLLKQQPERLASAIRRAVKEAEERARRRNAEIELVRREKYFRTLTENSLDVLSIISRERKLSLRQPVHRECPGLRAGGIARAKCFRARASPRICRARWRRSNPGLITRSARSKSNCAIKEKTANGGSWKSSARTGCRTRKSTGIVINCRDVTDRWRAEEDVRSSEKQYRLLFQGNPNPMWVFDLETLAFLEVNEAATRHYGYSREEFLAMTIADIRSPEKNDASKGIAFRTPPTAASSGGIVARTAV